MFILLLIILIFFYISYSDGSPRYTSITPIYMNMDMREMCSKADATNPTATNPTATNPTATDTTMPDVKKRVDNIPENDPHSLNFLYNNNDDYPMTGDDKLMFKMYDMSGKNKEAILNRAMWNKNALIPYLEEELRSHENSIWYDDETLEREF
jgi:hypothetical protein